MSGAAAGAAAFRRCDPCEVTWFGTDVCWSCDQPVKPRPAWPRFTFTLPGDAARTRGGDP